MKRRWTINDIERTGLQVNGIPVMGKALSELKPPPRIPKEEPEQLREIKQLLQLLQIDFETEYRFDVVRKFRFDIAITTQKIAIEYEGIIADKSRHTSIEGYTRDATKYNLAQVQGWVVLRYTVKNYKQAVPDVMQILEAYVL